MTPSQRWQRIQELCELLEAVPAAARHLELQRLEPDPALRHDTLALLQAMAEEEAERCNLPGPAATSPDPFPGSIRGIQLLDMIGSGGSSTVYRAIRSVDESRQMVAVKLFHDTSATPGQHARFVREQRILASLNHPGIVRFLDAGVSSSHRPYLVMELAQGQPITEYCDHHRLPLHARLRLFLEVCRAVALAHHQLIVHLDLKPSNVLVTPQGQIKLLDFGTAQIVEEGAELARTGHLTPLYASPERLRGESISVSCDIYALGLILYEILSGHWPFLDRRSLLGVAERAAGQAGIIPLSRRATPESAAARSSSPNPLRAALRGDLEAICAKALAENPMQRYSSAGRLADDLERHLNGAPVEAHPPSWTYRAGKALRRYAWAAAAVLSILLTLIAATAYSQIQARAARREAARAAAARDFLVSTFELSATDAAARREMTVRDVLEIASPRVEKELGADPIITSGLDLSLANAYLAQSDMPQARVVLLRALRRLPENQHWGLRARLLSLLGYVDYLQLRRAEALNHSLQSLQIYQSRRAEFSDEDAVLTLLSTSRTLSYLEPANPRFHAYLQDAVTIARSLPVSTGAPLRALCLYLLATFHVTVDFQPAQARRLLAEAIQIQRSEPRLSGPLGDSLLVLGLADRYSGQLAEAESAHRESCAIAERIFGAGSAVTATRQAHWAASLADLGRLDEAYSLAHRALAVKRISFPQPGSSLLWSNLHAASYTSCLLKRYSECEVLAREALTSLGPGPNPADYRLHDGQAILGLALAGLGRPDGARPLLAGSLQFNQSRRRNLPYAHLLAQSLAAR